MKRVIFSAISLVLFVTVGIFAYLEIRYGKSEVVPTAMTAQEVQTKCVEIILTGRDKTFVAAALDLAEIKEAQQTSQEETNVSGPVIEALVMEYYPEMKNWMVTVMGQSITLEGDLDETTRVYLQFSNMIYLRKLSAHYRDKGSDQVVTTMYENLNGETFQQYVERRVWFSYLKR